MESDTGLLYEMTIQARIGELLQVESPITGRLLVSGPLSREMSTTTRLYRGADPSWPGEGSQGEDFQGRFGSKTRGVLQAFFLTLAGFSPEELRALPPIERERLAADPLANFFGAYHLTRESNIPVGKGFSSSSADLLGALSLLDRHFHANLGRERIYRIAGAIEPTDPLLDSGTLLFDSREGHSLQQLPERDLALLYFDGEPHRTIDTCDPWISGLRENPGIGPGPKGDSEEAVVMDFLEAWEAGHLEGIFHATTRSALLSYGKRPRPGLALLYEYARNITGGLFVAHTGTLMGLLVSREDVTRIEGEMRAFVRNIWGVPLGIEYTTGETAMGFSPPEPGA